MSVDRWDAPIGPDWRLMVEKADHLGPSAAFVAIVLFSLGLWSAIWLAVSYLLL